MKCFAIRKDGTHCCYTAVADGLCRVHYQLLFKLQNRITRLERQLAAERERLAVLQQPMWPGNPS